jgi:hypothetical protein
LGGLTKNRQSCALIAIRLAFTPASQLFHLLNVPALEEKKNRQWRAGGSS